MPFTVLTSVDKDGKPEYFASGQFKNPEGIYIPYAKWLSAAESKAYVEDPDKIDEIMEDYKLTAFEFNKRSTAVAAAAVQYVDVISMRQCRLMLSNEGLLDDVEAILMNLPGKEGRNARIEWEYATEVRKDNPIFVLVLNQLGLAQDYVDRLFERAKRL